MLVLCLICCSNVSHGANELSESEKFSNSKELIKSARKNNIKRVGELLKIGCNINSVCPELILYSPEWTALMEAADWGHQDLLNFLIRYQNKDGQRLEIDQQDSLERDALMYTVFTGVVGRTSGKPGKETRLLAYSLLKRGSDYTAQSKNKECYVNLIEELGISEQDKKAMKKKSRGIVQNRWNTICFMWNNIRSTADNSRMPGDLVRFFFLFLYDETNDKLEIYKEEYIRLLRKKRDSVKQDNDRKIKRKEND